MEEFLFSRLLEARRTYISTNRLCGGGFTTKFFHFAYKAIFEMGSKKPEILQKSPWRNEGDFFEDAETGKRF